METAASYADCIYKTPGKRHKQNQKENPHRHRWPRRWLRGSQTRRNCYHRWLKAWLSLNLQCDKADRRLGDIQSNPDPHIILSYCQPQLNTKHHILTHI
jgi:hypothetical protein